MNHYAALQETEVVLKEMRHSNEYILKNAVIISVSMKQHTFE